MCEEGFVFPYRMVVASDSHSNMYEVHFYNRLNFSYLFIIICLIVSNVLGTAGLGV